jgi:hypothetical protein
MAKYNFFTIYGDTSLYSCDFNFLAWLACAALALVAVFDS